MKVMRSTLFALLLATALPISHGYSNQEELSRVNELKALSREFGEKGIFSKLTYIAKFPSKMGNGTATPAEERAYKLLMGGVRFTEKLKNDMKYVAENVDLSKTSMLGDLCRSFMFWDTEKAKQAQNRNTYRGIKKSTDWYIEETAKKMEENGYTNDVIEEYKKSNNVQRAVRFISGEGNFIDRCIFTVLNWIDRSIRKKRKKNNLPDLVDTAFDEAKNIATEETLIKIKEEIPKVLTAINEAGTPHVKPLVDLAGKTTKPVVDILQSGAELIVEVPLRSMIYTATKAADGTKWTIKATIDGKNYLLEKTSNKNEFVIKAKDKILETITATTENLTGAFISAKEMATGNALAIDQRFRATITNVWNTVTELAESALQQPNESLETLAQEVMTPEAKEQSAEIAKIEQAEKSIHEQTKELLKATTEQTKKTAASIAEGITILLNNPTTALSTGFEGLRTMIGWGKKALESKIQKEVEAEEEFYDAIGNPELLESLLKMLELTDEASIFDVLKKFTTIESEFSETTRLLFAQEIQGAAEQEDFMRIEPSEFAHIKETSEAFYKVLQNAWKVATPEQLLTVDPDNYHYFNESILHTIEEALEKKEEAEDLSYEEFEELATKNKALNKVLYTDSPTSGQPSKEKDLKEQVEGFDALIESITDPDELLKTYTEAPETIQNLIKDHIADKLVEFIYKNTLPTQEVPTDIINALNAAFDRAQKKAQESTGQQTGSARQEHTETTEPNSPESPQVNPETPTTEPSKKSDSTNPKEDLTQQQKKEEERKKEEEQHEREKLERLKREQEEREQKEKVEEAQKAETARQEEVRREHLEEPIP